MRWAFNSQTSGKAKSILVTLAYLTPPGRTNTHKNCQASLTELSNITGYSRTSIRASLKALEKEGHIFIGNPPGKSQIFTLNCRDLWLVKLP